MPRRTVTTALASIVTVLAAAACTAPRDTPPAPAPGVSSVPSAAPAPGAAVPGYQPVTRRVQAEGDVLSLTVEPLIRTGTTVVLTVRTSTVQNSGEPGPVVATTYFSGLGTGDFDGGRLIDETAGRVWATATGPGDGCVCTRMMRLERDETKPMQAAFAGVPADVTKLSVMLPWAGVFTDVPVVTGTVPTPPPGADLAGDVHAPLDLTTVRASVTAGLEAFSRRLDTAMTTRRTGGQVDISLDSDVLFRLDSDRLTPAAARTVAAAVADIGRAGPGALSITGHTDDSGSTAHNQRLSQQRARAVATALTARLPEARWPKTVAGRGESEPSVPNTGDANRRLNRRVSITFRVRPAASPEPASPAPARLPGTRGVVGSGATGVTVTLPRGHGRVRFTPRSVTARGDDLLVELVARNVGTGDVTFDQYLGTDLRTARGDLDPRSWFGSAGVRLLDGATAYYALDYRVPSGRRCLCDLSLARRVPPGSERVLPLWFPRPAGTTGTVTLDVPDRFRITGVPVT